MKSAVIHSRRHKSFKVTTNSNHKYPVSPNLLKRNFQQLEPNKVWVGDITYIRTGEGWLYLSTLKDLCTKKIVGYSFSSRIDTKLTLEALTMAVRRENPAKGLLHHTDRGVQYASSEYQEKLWQHRTKNHGGAEREISKAEVVEALARYKQKLELAFSKRELVLKGEASPILLKDIMYIEVFGKELHIHTVNGRVLSNQLLGNLQKQLPNPPFLHCHRAYIVNFAHVDDIDADFIMENGDKAYIRKKDYARVRDLYFEYLLEML